MDADIRIDPDGTTWIKYQINGVLHWYNTETGKAEPVITFYQYRAPNRWNFGRAAS